jgi:hypothetical protein
MRENAKNAMRMWKGSATTAGTELLPKGLELTAVAQTQ